MSINLKVNFIVQLELKLAYYDVTVQYVSFPMRNKTFDFEIKD